MKNWTVQKLVGCGFALVILLSSGICVYSILRLSTIQDQSLGLQKDHVPGLYLIGRLEIQTYQDEEAVGRFIATDDPQEIASQSTALEASRQEHNKILGDLDATTGTTPEEKDLFSSLSENDRQYLAARDNVISLRNARGTGSTDKADVMAIYKQQMQPRVAKFFDSVGKLQEHNKKEAEDALLQITGEVSSTNRVIAVGSAISLLVCILTAVSVVIQLSGTLKRLMMALIQVNSSATEMSATLKQQQASANEVASTSVEIGATAKEISATTRELGKTMSSVAEVSEQTAALATGGQAGLSRLEGTMRQIMGATTTISAKLAILNEKTSNINSVVTTINKVADQTNLLSLNAAIEAEKAGESGQGFAVVATEIRRLADQTAVATYDIEQMVKEMQSAVSAGVMGMDKFAEEVRRGNEEVCGVTAQLVQIIQQVQALTPRFESVNDGMQTQSTAAGQISDALTQLGETAQQSAQALRQNSEAIEQLTLAANGLQGAVMQFKSKG